MSAMSSARKESNRSTGFVSSLLTSAAVASLLSLPVAAQTPPADQPAATSSGGLEEIIVTARKRKENIQTTPVSVTALSADQLQQAQVHDISDLRGLVPNLEIVPESNRGRSAESLTIRGIGQPNFVANVDPGVGFYMDDLYVARPEGQLLGFYDLSDVQVLKGPQGTLFGKNTIGGAILVTTQLPTDQFEGYALFRAGEYNRIESEGALNVPINDKASLRFSFATSDIDGYINDVLDSGTKDDQHEKSVRVQTRLKPIDDLTIDLLGEWNYHHDDGQAYVVTNCVDPGPFSLTDNYDQTLGKIIGKTYCGQFPVIGKQYTVWGTPHAAVPTLCLVTGHCDPYFGNEPAFNKVEVWTVNLRMNYTIDDNLSVKSVTGFRRSYSNSLGGEFSDGGTPVCLYCEEDNTTTEEWYQEVYFTGNYMDNRLFIQGGAVYVDQESGFAQNTGPDNFDPTGYSFLDSQSFESDAVFAQASYKFTDELELTLGARYSYDHKNVESVLWNALGEDPARTGGLPTYLPNGEVNAGYLCYYTNQYGSSYCGAQQGGGGFNNHTGGYYIPGPGVNNPNGRQRAGHSYYDFDPRGQLSYRFTPDIYGYVSITGGYQSGGFNTQLGPGIGPTNGMIPYQKERVWNYEAGLRTEWFNKRLRVNATGFHQEFDNIQATVTNPFLVVPTRFIVNAAAAHEDGFELEITAEPTPDLVIHANGSSLRQGYDSLSPFIAQINAYEAAHGKAAVLSIDDPIVSAPKYEGNISVDYTYQLPWEASLIGDLTYRWVGTRIFGIDNRVLGTLSEATPYYNIDAKLTYVSDDGKYTASVWGKNLTGKYYGAQVCNHLCGSTGLNEFFPGRPREVGVELKYKFSVESAPEEAVPYTPPPPAPAPAPVARSYMVFFDFDKSDLTPDAVKIVDQAAANAGPAKATTLTVTGHTDTVGSDAYNMRLGKRRAESVAAELEKDGVPASEIQLVSKGKHDLLVPTKDGVREPQNRRVTIVYEGPTS